MTRIGFTGTQAGMTKAQATCVMREILARMPLGVFHHGDCIGADAQAHDAALMAGAQIHIHPCDIPALRGWKTADYASCPKRPLDRNRDIVEAVDVMIAAPRMFIEELRSGTWATIRYTRKMRKPLVIVWPDGRAELFGPHNA